MKKYNFILLIVLLLFFVGCANIEKTVKTENKGNVTLSATNDKIFIDVKSMDETSTFPFRMTKDNVVIKLKELKLEVKNEIEITSEEDDPEFGNKQIWTDGIIFSFDKNNDLYCINVNENIPTSLHLKKGDSLEKTENLYGKKYTKHNTDTALVYEYTFADHYFRVFLEEDKVTQWVVSKYKLSNYHH